MAETERRNKERDLANQSRDLQRMQREFREDLNLRRNEELAAVQERANKVIQQIAEAEKFDLIIQDPVVYASQKIDITEKVIKALADKYAPKGADAVLAFEIAGGLDLERLSPRFGDAHAARTKRRLFES